MDIPNDATGENQSPDSTAQNKSGGMDALNNAIKAQLEALYKSPEVPESKTEITESQHEDDVSDIQDEQQEDSLNENEQDSESQDTDESQGKKKRDPNHNWQKRVDRLTGRNKDLQEQLEALQAEHLELKRTVNESSPKRTSQTDVGSLASRINSEPELDNLEAEAREAERWAKRNLARYKRDPEAVEREVKAKTGTIPDDVEQTLEEILFNSEDLLISDIPSRRKQIQAQARSYAEATKHYPWLADSRNQLTGWVNSTLEQYGDMKLSEIPDIHRFMARSLIGMHFEQQNASKTRTTPPKAEPTSQPTKPRIERRQTTSSEEQISQARSRVDKERSIKSMADWIKAAANAR